MVGLAAGAVLGEELMGARLGIGRGGEIDPGARAIANQRRRIGSYVVELLLEYHLGAPIFLVLLRPYARIFRAAGPAFPSSPGHDLARQTSRMFPESNPPGHSAPFSTRRELCARASAS